MIEVPGHPLKARDEIEARSFIRDMAYGSLFGLPPKKQSLWLASRIRAKRDLLWFCRNVLGLVRLSEEIHRPPANFTQRIITTPHGFGNLRDPRGNGKTSLTTRGAAIWSLIQDPIECKERKWPIRGRESRLGIVTLKKDFTLTFMDLLLEDLVGDELTWTFPEILPETPKRWGQRAIEVRRGLKDFPQLQDHPMFVDYPALTRFPDPTFAPRGLEGGAAGAHTQGEFIDDPVNEKTWESSVNIDTAVQGIRLIYSITKPEKGFRLVTGNAWGPGDVVSRIDAEDGNWKVFMRSMEVCEDCKDGFPLDSRGIPEKDQSGRNSHKHRGKVWVHVMPEEDGHVPTVEEVMLACGSKHIFMAQYQNDPVAGEATAWNASTLPEFEIINRANDGKLDNSCEIRYYYKDENGEMQPQVLKIKDCYVTITFDTSHGSTAKDASENAITVLARTPHDTVLSLETFSEVMDEPLDALMYLVGAILRFKPKKVGIDSTGYQRTIKPLLINELVKHKVGWLDRDKDIVPIVRSKEQGSKESFIRDGLGSLILARRLLLCPAADGFSKTYAQIDAWPVIRKWDIADSLSMHPHLWRDRAPKSPEKRKALRLKQATRDRRLRHRSGVSYGWG